MLQGIQGQIASVLQLLGYDDAAPAARAPRPAHVHETEMLTDDQEAELAVQMEDDRLSGEKQADAIAAQWAAQRAMLADTNVEFG